MIDPERTEDQEEAEPTRAEVVRAIGELIDELDQYPPDMPLG